MLHVAKRYRETERQRDNKRDQDRQREAERVDSLVAV
jgi:hypothetical protein